MDSHWDGCWEAHHECAIVEIGRLKAELTEVNRAADMSAFEVGRLRAVLSRIEDSITDIYSVTHHNLLGETHEKECMEAYFAGHFKTIQEVIDELRLERTRTPNVESKSAAQLMADAGVPNMLEGRVLNLKQ
jgi:hypothetical protein